LVKDLIISHEHFSIKQTGISQIACSGGVFMNVKLNQKIQEMPEVTKAYFMPSCGDESNTIGSAMISYMKHNFPLEKLAPINTMYLGISYEESEVDTFLRENAKNYTITKFDSDETSMEKVADLLTNHEVVAIMRGQGEWGARSLCHRAILSNASDLKNFHMVNDMIKMRDFWMPFAPTILQSAASRYLKDWDTLGKKVYESAHYMINTFASTPLANEHLRAAMHQRDKTLRPQLVSRETNVWMTGMLEKFEEKTGM
jgi:carbamoyltransferase